MKKLLFITAFALLATFEMTGQSISPEKISITNNTSPYPGLVIYSHDQSNTVPTSHPIIQMLSTGGTSNATTPIGNGKVLGELLFSGGLTNSNVVE